MKQPNMQHYYADSMSGTWAGATKTLYLLERAVTHAFNGKTIQLVMLLRAVYR